MKEEKAGKIVRLKVFLWTGLCIAGIAATAVFLLIKNAEIQAPPLYETVKHSYEQSDALLLDRHGEVIHQIRVDEKGRRLEWASLNSVSPAFTSAVLFVEDKRFYRHNGTDWFAMGTSVLKNLGSKRLRGASTVKSGKGRTPNPVNLEHLIRKRSNT